jgi:hypothetical protein
MSTLDYITNPPEPHPTAREDSSPPLAIREEWQIIKS